MGVQDIRPEAPQDFEQPPHRDQVAEEGQASLNRHRINGDIIQATEFLLSGPWRRYRMDFNAMCPEKLRLTVEELP
jgi:hypothetical protein